MSGRPALAVLLAALAASCGEMVVELDPTPSERPDAADDGDAARACVPGATACTNCADDDGDGQVDGFDIECTGAADNDESSFETGIAGDNQDVTLQDCFFDGDSGAGGPDGCALHVCCLLEECPPDLPGPPFDPAECTDVTVECIENCQPLVPPGCDCFGCCTLCDGDECHDVYTHPEVAPDCDADALADPAACPRCEKVTTCAQECGVDQCILCPGQSADDLPPGCSAQACPDGAATCAGSADCADDEFCASGCCIAVVD